MYSNEPKTRTDLHLDINVIVPCSRLSLIQIPKIARENRGRGHTNVASPTAKHQLDGGEFGGC